MSQNLAQASEQDCGELGQHPSGTGLVIFSPVLYSDTIGIGYFSFTIQVKFQCITCMKEYESKSLEELRLEDYTAGRKKKDVFDPTTKNTKGTEEPKTDQGMAGANNDFLLTFKYITRACIFCCSFTSSTCVFCKDGAAEQLPPGTGRVQYSPVLGFDLVVKGSSSYNVWVKYHCITCMKEYGLKSFEELRLEDYAAGRKGNPDASIATSDAAVLLSEPICPFPDSIFSSVPDSVFATVPGLISTPTSSQSSAPALISARPSNLSSVSASISASTSNQLSVPASISASTSNQSSVTASISALSASQTSVPLISTLTSSQSSVSKSTMTSLPCPSSAKDSSPVPGSSSTDHSNILQNNDTKLYPNLALPWQSYLKTGLPQIVKENLLHEYTIPENFLLKGPILNADISVKVGNDVRKRDGDIQKKQDQLGHAIAAINEAMSLVLNQEKIPEAIGTLNDACKILADLHFCETRDRIDQIASLFDDAVSVALLRSERDETLFGIDLNERIDFDKVVRKKNDVEIDSAFKIMAVPKQETAALCHETTSLGQESAASSQQTDSLSHEAASLRQESAASSQQTDSLSHEAASLGQESAASSLQTDSLSHEAASLGQESAASSQQTDALIQESATLSQRTAISSHQTKFSDLESNFSALKTAVSDLKSGIISKETLTLSQESVSSSQESGILSQEASSLNQEATVLSQEDSSLNQEAAVLSQDDSSLNHKAAVLSQEDSSLNQEAAGLSQEDSSLNHKAAVLSQEASSLNQEAAVLSQEASSLNQEVAVLNREDSSLNQETAVLSQENEYKKQSVTNTHAEGIQAEEEDASLKGQSDLESLRLAIQDLLRDTVSLKTTLYLNITELDRIMEGRLDNIEKQLET